jgi:hypothetical protein
MFGGAGRFKQLGECCYVRGVTSPSSILVREPSGTYRSNSSVDFPHQMGYENTGLCYPLTNLIVMKDRVIGSSKEVHFAARLY